MGNEPPAGPWPVCDIQKIYDNQESCTAGRKGKYDGCLLECAYKPLEFGDSKENLRYETGDTQRCCKAWYATFSDQREVDKALAANKHFEQPVVSADFKGYNERLEKFYDKPHPFLPNRADSVYAQVDVEFNDDGWGAEGWQ